MANARTIHGIPNHVAGGLPALVATIGAAAALGYSLLSAPSSTPPSTSLPPLPTPAASSSSVSAVRSPRDLLPRTQRGAPGELGPGLGGPTVDRGAHGFVGKSDGVVPSGVTVFDSGYPAVSKLDPALRGALRAAATAAGRDGVTFQLDSGWRSRAYQEQLFREAVAEYGSPEQAARWVAVPGTSTHESGDAADIGPSVATAWLSAHGARYGLCQIYRNEPWHVELRPDAVDAGCPPMYADPTHDPRLQR